MDEAKVTIKILVMTDDAGMAVNVGGHVHTSYRSFDVDAPELEAFLREPTLSGWTYKERRIVGEVTEK